MSDIFDSICSVYEDAKDNCGRYVDRETGEIITEMSIREFCLTDRWKPIVDELRAMVDKYGEKEAKAMPEYKAKKELLPGATLSGRFELREVEVEKTNRYTGEKFMAREMVSRRQAHLLQHTGFLCIDIDRQDNQSLQDMKVILRTLRHRPEVALCMKSCSGTGYFVLIQLEYPQYHKEQFAALLREYAALGITIDRKCSDVTRVRFASYDADPYVNPNAFRYTGLILETQVLAPKAAVGRTYQESDDDLVQKVERLVRKLEALRIDITYEYDVWYKIGISLANLGYARGLEYFKRVSAISPKYNEYDCQRKYDYNSTPGTISIAYFFARCKEAGVTLRD